MNREELNKISKIVSVAPRTIEDIGKGKLKLPIIKETRHKRNQQAGESIVYLESITPEILDIVKQSILKTFGKNAVAIYRQYIITRSEAIRVLGLDFPVHKINEEGFLETINNDVVICNSPKHKELLLSNPEALKNMFDLN